MDLAQIDQCLSKNPRKTFWAVTLISFLIAVGLAAAAWDMQFWPTDAEVYYLPAARELPSLKYLSQIHDSLDTERIKWLHGKEILVLTICLFQKLLHDTETLRPLLLIGVVSVFVSSILIFVVARRLWGHLSGLVVWFLFATSLWPYVYILFAKHQTQGLALFLLAVFLLLCSLKGRLNFVFMIASGAALAASVYSSTVSALYAPYLLAVFGYVVYQRGSRAWLIELVRDGVLIMLGFAAVLFWVNYPNIGYNLKSYVEYVSISGAFNHFYYNQSNLVQWIPSFDLKDTRGGWNWIIRYFFLIMPVVFPLYILSAAYLIKRSFTDRTWFFTIGAIVLSFSSPLLAEIKGVAQYGANYFTVFVGVLFLIGYACSRILKSEGHSKNRMIQNAVIALLIVQLTVNAWIFITDIYPSRMVTTHLSRKIEQLNVSRLATFPTHPLRRNLIDHLLPNVLQKIQWTPIQSILDVSEGYIVLPPVSTDSIYLASTSNYMDFDGDPFLTELMRQGRVKDYAVASFPTLSSSLIWAQEEEILAFRSLVQNNLSKNKDKARVWILDAALLSRDRERLMPSREELVLIAGHVDNIGTDARTRIFEGHRMDNAEAMVLKGIATRIYKVGDPQDSLRAYVYKVEATQPMWVPNDPGFASRPVDAQSISNDPQGGLVEFVFDRPVTLEPGRHLIVIYRTHSASDRNFYRIYRDFVGRMQ